MIYTGRIIHYSLFVKYFGVWGGMVEKRVWRDKGIFWSIRLILEGY